MKKKNIKNAGSFDVPLDFQYGKIGTNKRDDFQYNIKAIFNEKENSR